MISPMAEKKRDRSRLVRVTIEVEPEVYRALMDLRGETRRPVTRIVEEWINEKLADLAANRAQS